MSVRHGVLMMKCKDHGLKEPVEVCPVCLLERKDEREALRNALKGAPVVIDQLCKLVKQAKTVVQELDFALDHEPSLEGRGELKEQAAAFFKAVEEAGNAPVGIPE